MRKIKEEKGITLIALVITIVILLILVAISMVTLTGKNGMLTKVKTAKTLTEIEEIKEVLELEKASYIAEIYEKGEKLDLTGYIKYLQEKSLVKFDEEFQDIEENKKIVTIKGNIFILTQNDQNIEIKYQEGKPKRKEIRLPINVTADINNDGEASSNSCNVYQQAWHAFDDNKSSAWVPSPGFANSSLSYKFNNGFYKCNEIEITFSYWNSERGKFSYVFQGSNNGGQWENITEVIVTSEPETRKIPTNTTEKYSYYRFQSLNGAVLNQGSWCILISDLRFICEGDYDF